MLPWTEISAHFGNHPIDAEKARLWRTLFSIANEASRHVDILKRAALRRMGLDYKRRS
jgi:hypothetical protein